MALRPMVTGTCKGPASLGTRSGLVRSWAPCKKLPESLLGSSQAAVVGFRRLQDCPIPGRFSTSGPKGQHRGPGASSAQGQTGSGGSCSAVRSSGEGCCMPLLTSCWWGEADLSPEGCGLLWGREIVSGSLWSAVSCSCRLILALSSCMTDTELYRGL